AEEHVFSAAQPDALRSERARLNRVPRNIRVGANFHLAMRIGPLHELLQLWIIRRGIQRTQLSLDDPTCRSIQRDPVSFSERLALHSHLTRFFVHIDIACPRHAALAPASGYDRGVTGHAT